LSGAKPVRVAWIGIGSGSGRGILATAEGSDLVMCEAASIREALELPGCDAVLLLLDAPPEALARLQETPGAPPALVVVAAGDEAGALRALAAGAQEVLVDGAPGATLPEAVHRALARQRTPRPQEGPTLRLRRHNEILRALAKSQAAGPLESQLRAITEAASQSMDVARTSIWIYDEQHTAIRVLDLFERPEGRHSSGTELRACDFLEYFTALEAERVIVAHDACRDPATRCFADVYLRPLNIGSLLDAPIRVSGRVVGVICHEHVGPPRTWTDEDQSAAGSMADFVSLAMEGHERRRAEASLRENQEMLQHAQKMDALGRLAGGMAHDFNNLLTVIIGYARIVSDQLVGDPILANVKEISAAGERARELTGQLLAVSRRQILRTESLDLNQVVGELEKMLLRLIGADLTLTSRLQASPSIVSADRGQLEQVLLNLVLNARDATPAGGTITMSTHNEDGVVLSVTDTGHGIAPEVKARIFEPFFTTKPVGKGTGLGLSMVYGIVHQSGGTITVRSEPGEGATFAVRLPSAVAQASDAPENLEPEPNVRGTETILVVEDEMQLRQLAKAVLEPLGYTVLLACDVDEALGHCRKRSGKIHLLISDVVMPKASGPVVAERVLELCPKTAVLFISGYAVSALDGIYPSTIPAAQFLQKPYTPETLGRRVRQALDRRSHAPASRQ